MMECLTDEIYEKGLAVINEVSNLRPMPERNGSSHWMRKACAGLNVNM